MQKLLMMSALALAVSAGGAVAQEQYVLRFSQHQSQESSVFKTVIEPFKETVEELSNGQITVETFPNGTLHAASDGFKALVTDITDIAMILPVYNSQAFHLTDGLYLPGAFQSVYAANRIGEELYPEYLKSEFQDVGVELAFEASSSPYQLLSTKKIETLEDLQGMKIRGGGGAINKMVEALGATPVTLAAPEMYTAFQQGLVDGILVPVDAMLTYRLEELTRYFVPLDIGQAGIPYGINRQTLSELPDDLKQVVYEASREAGMHYADNAQAGVDKGMAALRANDVVFVEFSDEDKARLNEIRDVLWDEFATELEAEGYPAEEFLAKMSELSDKYGAMTRDELIALNENEPVEGIWPE